MSGSRHYRLFTELLSGFRLIDGDDMREVYHLLYDYYDLTWNRVQYAELQRR